MVDESTYDLEIEKVAAKITKEKAKTVLIQLPDGLKPKAREVKQALSAKAPDAKILFWGASCFGACDIPTQAEKLGVDLIIQFGHSEWK
jgi:diphthamide biosynthesis enzyme Dph1/Dph2-like protein